MKVLILGSGGREHAIAHSVSKSKLLTELFILPGNAGTKTLGTNVDIDINNIEDVLNFAKSNSIDLTIVGPETPITLGIANTFIDNGLKIFSPTKEAGEIETSKLFAKKIMEKYEIPTGKYKEFNDYSSATSYVEQNNSYPCVIKYNGLAAGKGVFIAQNYEEADLFLYKVLEEKILGNDGIIIEEFLEGDEFTILAFVHGDNVSFMPVARDFKRVFNDDQGDNTGGMGCICPYEKNSIFEIAEAKQIMLKTARALKNEGKSFTGVLYGGFIATKDGIKVIEFNARFGDPETEVILQKVKSDILEVILDIMDNKKVKLLLNPGVYCGVVLTAKGYPDKYIKNIDVSEFVNNDLVTYHMSTVEENNKYLSKGGRVICVTASGDSPREAFDNIYTVIDEVSNEHIHYRTDLINY